MTTESTGNQDPNPHGIRTESTRIPDVEQNREEQNREVEVPLPTHHAHGIRTESVSTILSRHIDDPTGTRHRGIWLNPTHWRCMDCLHTLDLTPRPSSLKPTSTSHSPLALNDPTACPQHLGQPASHCGPCRSEQLAPLEDDVA